MMNEESSSSLSCHSSLPPFPCLPSPLPLLVILNEVKDLSADSGGIQILRSAQDDKGGTGVDATEGRTTTKVDANEGRTIPYKDLWK